VAVVPFVLAAAPADDAATALREDPVYVAPDAEAALSAVDAEDLRRRVETAGTPVFVALLPRSAGERGEVLRAMRDGVGVPGTYVLVLGDELWAASDVLASADELATAAIQEHASNGVSTTLDALVDDLRVAAAEGGGGGAPAAQDRSRSASDEGDDGSGGSPVLLLVLAVAVVGGLVWLTVRRRRKEQARRREALQAREDLRPSLTVLADDVLALEPEVAVHEEARADYEEAVRRYRWAEAAIGQVDTLAEAGRVQRVLDEGHYAMARARAITQGRRPPDPPPELAVPGPNREPPVVVGDDGMPGYVGWGGGWYGGGWFGGDLLTGLALGSILSGPGWGWGGGYGGGDGGEGGEGGGDDGGGGFGDLDDIGGGDLGDGGGFGDFGGGDFGGGDF
jgi:hypothetical protein